MTKSKCRRAGRRPGSRFGRRIGPAIVGSYSRRAADRRSRRIQLYMPPCGATPWSYSATSLGQPFAS